MILFTSVVEFYQNSHIFRDYVETVLKTMPEGRVMIRLESRDRAILSALWDRLEEYRKQTKCYIKFLTYSGLCL